MLNVILNNKHLNMLDKSTPVVLALSGGVDSMVLFDLLLKCDYKVVVAHVNHHKRLESEIEENFIRDLANKNNCPLEVLHFYHEKENFQAEAHEKRYDFFKKVAIKYNSSTIITAHHYADNLETIIINIIRGSNLYGYGGISDVVCREDIKIIRPLINVKKEEIYEYARNNNVTFFEDSSNKSDEYLRNRIRHHILPILENENPNLKESISNYSNQVQEAFQYIRSSSVKYLTENENKIVVNSFNLLALIVKKDIINYICEQNGILSTENKINDILNLIQNPKPNLVYDLNNDYQFVKAYDLCYISLKTENQPVLTTIDIDQEIKIDGYGTFILSKEIKSDLFLEISQNEPLPLTIRHRQNGDKLIIGDGHKKLKDFLIDKKVPKEKRDKLLVVTNNLDEIIWVIGYYKKKNTSDNSLNLCFKEKIYEC